MHPAEAIEDPDIALAGIGAAFLALDDLPTKGQRSALISGIERAAGLTLTDAGELAVLGRWIMEQSDGPGQSVSRLSRRLYKMRGAEGFPPLMTVIDTVAKAGDAQLSRRQKEALGDMRQGFRLG